MAIQPLSSAGSPALRKIRRVFALRHQLRRLTWLALTAMLALALMPTLSHALALARGEATGLAEVCTPQGPRWVSLKDGAPVSDPAPAQAFAHLDHCPFCAQLGAPLGMPPAPLAFAAPAGLGHAMPRLFHAAPRPLFAWRAAQPRAPPSFS
jgi:hypothetical protein